MKYSPIVFIIILLMACSKPKEDQQEIDSTALVEVDTMYNDEDPDEEADTFEEYDLLSQGYNWSIGDNPVPENEYPGTLKKYLILEDDTEIDAKEYTVENGYAYSEGEQMDSKSVKAVRFEVVLNKPMDIRFAAETYYSDESEYNIQFTKDFRGAEPSRPYSVTIGNTPQNTMVMCSVVRVTVFAGSVTAAATVIGSCGD